MISGPRSPDALEKNRQQAQQLHRNARAVYRAMEGWQRVRSEEDWVRISEESQEAYESGRFLLDRLGAERHLDPKLMATLMSLRQALIAEWGITTAAETMLLDLAVLRRRARGRIGHLKHASQDALSDEEIKRRLAWVVAMANRPGRPRSSGGPGDGTDASPAGGSGDRVTSPCDGDHVAPSVTGQTAWSITERFTPGAPSRVDRAEFATGE